MFQLVLSIIIPLAAGYLSILFIKKNLAASASSEVKKLSDALEHKDSELRNVPSPSDGFWSKKQLQKIETMTTELQSQIEASKNVMTETERKLTLAQTQVDEKEKAHQGLKIARDEDTATLSRLLSDGPSIVDQASALEKQLADHFKSLETKIADPNFNPLLKEVTQELFNAVSTIADRIRSLIIEQKTITDRVNALKTQQEQLETEYTNLVEQNLG